jgi:hypothetical protein
MEKKIIIIAIVIILLLIGSWFLYKKMKKPDAAKAPVISPPADPSLSSVQTLIHDAGSTTVPLSPEEIASLKSQQTALITKIASDKYKLYNYQQYAKRLTGIDLDSYNLAYIQPWINIVNDDQKTLDGIALKLAQ